MEKMPKPSRRDMLKGVAKGIVGLGAVALTAKSAEAAEYSPEKMNQELEKFARLEEELKAAVKEGDAGKARKEKLRGEIAAQIKKMNEMTESLKKLLEQK